MAAPAYGTIPVVLVAPMRRKGWGNGRKLAAAGLLVAAVVTLISAAAWTNSNPVVLEEDADNQPTAPAWPGPYTAVPYRQDARTGITQWTATPMAAPMLPAMYPMPGAPPMMPAAGPPMLPGAPPPYGMLPGAPPPYGAMGGVMPPHGVPPGDVNTWSSYPYGPLPPGGPLPGLQAAPGPMYGPPPVTQIVFNSSSADDRHIEINIPQPPTMVSFPPVKLDPEGAPFGSTPNTAEAFNAYTQSTGFGAALMPAINFSYSSKPVRIMPPPNAPVSVDLFTGTGPNDEPPYHIAGTTAGFYHYEAKKQSSAKKQERLQALYNDYVSDYLASHTQHNNRQHNNRLRSARKQRRAA